MKNIESLIAQVKVVNDKYETIKRINGENFNIFSILKLERDEVKTHSYFIYELLDPQGSHNQGDIFLKLFLKKILGKKRYGDILEVHREDLTQEDRRIDFTIETSDYIIGIEMKVDAADQKNQLYDYKKELNYRKKANQETMLFYLTLTGNEASSESINGLVFNKDYHAISFYYDIYSWIEKCIEKSSTIPTLREGLVHYRNLIRKLTNQTSHKIGDEMEKILNKPEDVKAAFIITNEYPKILAKKEADFWYNLYKEIKNRTKFFELSYFDKSDFDLDNDEKIDYEEIAKERKKSNCMIGISAVKEDKPYSIQCDIYKWNTDDHIVIDFQVFENDIEKKLESANKILKEIGFNRKCEDSRWAYLKETIKFYGDGEPTFELFDDEKFEKLVEKTADEVVDYLENILKKEKDIFKILDANKIKTKQ